MFNTTPPILRMGHPTLHQVAKPVQDVHSESCREAIAQMHDVVQQIGQPVGLAAPQIGIGLRIVLFQLPRHRSDTQEEIAITTLINPEILTRSEACELGWERCLSLVELTGEVSRSIEITYRYQTEGGQQVEREARGMHARIIQHEIDHLDGILYPQRMSDITKLMYYEEFAKQAAAT